MDKRALFVPLLLAFFLPLHALDFSLALTAVPGVAYSGVVDPAFTGASAALEARLPYRSVSFRAGIEAGVSGLGVQLLAPVGVDRAFLNVGPCSFLAFASVIPGLAMFKPRPLFMYGAEFGSSCSWYWSDHWGLDVRLGIRYLSCPEYSARVARYEVVDFPVSAAIRYRL
jgi:hypothetical protein